MSLKTTFKKQFSANINNMVDNEAVFEKQDELIQQLFDGHAIDSRETLMDFNVGRGCLKPLILVQIMYRLGNVWG